MITITTILLIDIFEIEVIKMIYNYYVRNTMI